MLETHSPPLLAVMSCPCVFAERVKEMFLSSGSSANAKVVTVS